MTLSSVVQYGGTAVLSAAVALFFFSPRLALFRGLGIASAQGTPEINRAADALRQLHDPFAPIGNFSNLVLEWRLFFPLLGHALHLPDWTYLALPPLGCLLVLAFVVSVLQEHGWTIERAFLGGVLVATCSWFFVSTGWLAYFDSFCVLGGLIVAFASSRWIVVAAVLVTPWIDERFVFSLPLCLVVRDIRMSMAGSRTNADRAREFVAVAAALLPWIGIRLGAFLLRSDAVTRVYATTMAADKKLTLLSSYVAGLWHGLRWAWLVAGGGVVATWRRSGRAGIVLAVVTVGTLLVQIVLAGDISRSVSTILPVVFLGLLLLGPMDTNRMARWALPALCALNLLFPARHVFGNTRIPIFYLYTEWENARHPPVEVDARSYQLRGETILANEGLPKALEYLDAAILLDPRQARAYASRAVAHYRLGHLPQALADANRAVELDPQFLEARHLRSHLRAETGDVRGAETDLEYVVRAAPNAWPSRPQAENELRIVRQELKHSS